MLRGSLCVFAVLLLGCAITETPGDTGVEPTFNEDTGPEIYTTESIFSPITPNIAERIRSITGLNGNDITAFAKLGDEQTASVHFLSCLSTPPKGLSDELQTAWEFYATSSKVFDPFGRISKGAANGWGIEELLSESGVSVELLETGAALSLVLTGVNDVGSVSVIEFGRLLRLLVKQHIEQGVVPVLFSQPFAAGSTTAFEQDWFNKVTRAIAQAEQIPFVDLAAVLAEVQEDKLLGVAEKSGLQNACDFTSDSLGFGYNARNHATLFQLERLYQVTGNEVVAIDQPGLKKEGLGTVNSPEIAPFFPASFSGNTQETTTRLIDEYSGCAASQDESGPEVFYQLEIVEPGQYRAVIVDDDSSDLDLHVLYGGLNGEACVVRGDRDVTWDAEVGTYYLSVDTYVSGGVEKAGEYVVVVDRVDS